MNKLDDVRKMFEDPQPFLDWLRQQGDREFTKSKPGDSFPWGACCPASSFINGDLSGQDKNTTEHVVFTGSISRQAFIPGRARTVYYPEWMVRFIKRVDDEVWEFNSDEPPPSISASRAADILDEVLNET